MNGEGGKAAKYTVYGYRWHARDQVGTRIDTVHGRWDVKQMDSEDWLGRGVVEHSKFGPEHSQSWLVNKCVV